LSSKHCHSPASFGAPRITKDGVTVAKEIELGDKFENMGAQMVREVASKTSTVAGDGTTTATVLAQAIVREGAKGVAAGMNPMDLKRGIDKAVAAVVEELKKHTKKLTTPAETAQVGTISANGYAEIGKMISEAMQKVGNEGVITVEEAKGIQTELDIVEGMQFDRGYVSPYFVTNAEKMVAELDQPYGRWRVRAASPCRTRHASYLSAMASARRAAPWQRMSPGSDPKASRNNWRMASWSAAGNWAPSFVPGRYSTLAIRLDKVPTAARSGAICAAICSSS
jgi:hypothetical protein